MATPDFSKIFQIEGQSIDVIEENVRKKGREILTRVGTYFKGQADKAFRRQRRGSVRWRARKVPNMAGILKDLETAPRVKERRFSPRPALIDTRSMARLNFFDVLSDTQMKMGNEADYSEKHQLGGNSIIRVTSAMRANAAKYLFNLSGVSRRAANLKDPRALALASGLRRVRAKGTKKQANEFGKRQVERGVVTKKELRQAKSINRGRQAKGRFKVVVDRLTSIMDDGFLSIDVPERPIWAVTQEDEQEVVKIVKRSLKRRSG